VSPRKKKRKNEKASHRIAVRKGKREPLLKVDSAGGGDLCLEGGISGQTLGGRWGGRWADREKITARKL
jgi:hypothetical protein